MTMTQIQGYQAPKRLIVNGVPYNLKKDAMDSSVVFPIEKMSWINANSEMLMGAYCNWIVGVIPPSPNTLEHPVSVFAIGFSKQKKIMHPNVTKMSDLQSMHYYIAESLPFIEQFVKKFLGLEAEVEAQEDNHMTPFPEFINGTNTQQSTEESSAAN